MSAIYQTFSLNGERYCFKHNETDEGVYLYISLKNWVGVTNVRTNYTGKPKAIELDRNKVEEWLDEHTERYCPSEGIEGRILK